MPPSQSHRTSREGESTGLRGHTRIAMAPSVVSVAWVVSLVAFVALWTLAPSIIYLQSMQRHAAEGGSADPFATQAALQHSRRMRGHGPPSLSQDSSESTAAAPGTIPDCQRLQQAQLARDEQHLTTESGQASTPAQRDAHLNAAEEQSQLQHAQQPSQQQQQYLDEQQVVATEQPAALDPIHGLPGDLVKQLGPVDIVYMWVNGSDPVLAQELQDFEASQHKQAADAPSPEPQWLVKDNNPVRQSRFDSDQDELRYSLRSLEMYMPWFNKVYIITNGQVPTWLNHYLSRVQIVPHTTIFKNHKHLPTFNSNAIATNLANIPGLSETFILLDDDVFLTAPWTLADLVGPDGGHILTGSTLVSGIKPEGRLYFEMLTHTNKLYDKHFGPHPRYDPAHAPRLMQKKYLQELQDKIPDAFEQTSAAHARLPTDIMLGAGAYPWYVSQFQPGKHPIAPDARTTFSTMSDTTAREYWNAAVNDFRASLAAEDPLATAFNQQHAKDWFNEVALTYKMQAGRGDGPKCAAVAQNHLHKLIQTWSQPGAKNVVMNDDITDGVAAARPLMNAVIRGFLEARYSRKSSFELSMHNVNGCEGRLPKTEFGQLPTFADFKLLCKPPPPRPTTAFSAHTTKQVPIPSTSATATHAAGATPHSAAAAAPVAISTNSAGGTPSIHHKAVPTLATLIKTPGQVGPPHPVA